VSASSPSSSDTARLPKGGRRNPAGHPIVLRRWQRDIVHGLFDQPRPRQGLVSVARKNGKSLLAACLGLYGLLGDGEESAEVLIGSVDEQTARVIFNLCRRMVELDELAVAAHEVGDTGSVVGGAGPRRQDE
jgi:phage terminase large subunit-like protein